MTAQTCTSHFKPSVPNATIVRCELPEGHTDLHTGIWSRQEDCRSWWTSTQSTSERTAEEEK